MDWKQIVEDQINHKETEAVPSTIHFEEPLARKITEHLGNSGWQDGLVNSIINVGCFDTWDTLAPIGDNRLIDAYGSIWEQTDDIAHLIKPVLEENELEVYHFPQLDRFVDDEKFQRMKQLLEVNQDKYPVGSIGAGIYELTWRLLGVEETLVKMLTEPEEIEWIFDQLMTLLYQFVDKVCELPIEAVMIGDDWSDQRGIIFGAERWREMIKPRYEALYAYIHSKGKKTITHCCGSVREVIPDLIGIGLDVLESVQPEANGMDPFELKRAYGSQLTFWGGLGCQSSVTYAKPEDLRKTIISLRQEMSKGGGYILAPTKTLNVSIPIENALILLEEFGKSV